jgi:hypothetical protein
MNNVKVGDWVVNVRDGKDLTLGKKYQATRVNLNHIKIIDDIGAVNELFGREFKLAPQKYKNAPREEYRPILEKFMAGADIDIDIKGFFHSAGIMSGPADRYRVNPDSILPAPDERKERIKQQLLKIDADKLAQLIIDAGIEL